MKAAQRSPAAAPCQAPADSRAWPTAGGCSSCDWLWALRRQGCRDSPAAHPRRRRDGWRQTPGAGRAAPGNPHRGRRHRGRGLRASWRGSAGLAWGRGRRGRGRGRPPPAPPDPPPPPRTQTPSNLRCASPARTTPEVTPDTPCRAASRCDVGAGPSLRGTRALRSETDG